MWRRNFLCPRRCMMTLSFFHRSNSSLDIFGNANIKRSCLTKYPFAVIRDLSGTSSRLYFSQGYSLFILVLLLITVLSQWVPSKNPKKDCLRKGRRSSPFSSMSIEVTHPISTWGRGNNAQIFLFNLSICLK